MSYESRYAIGSSTWYWGSSYTDDWSYESGGSNDYNGPPEDTDYAYLDGYSGDVQLQEQVPAWGELGSLDLSGFYGYFDGNWYSAVAMDAYLGGYISNTYFYTSYTHDGYYLADDVSNCTTYLQYGSSDYMYISGSYSYSMGDVYIDNSQGTVYVSNGFICDYLEITSSGGTFDYRNYSPVVEGDLYHPNHTDHASHGWDSARQLEEAATTGFDRITDTTHDAHSSHGSHGAHSAHSAHDTVSNKPEYKTVVIIERVN